MLRSSQQNHQWLKNNFFGPSRGKRSTRSRLSSDQPPAKSRFAIETLEPRVLLNADAVVTDLGAAVEGGLISASDNILSVIGNPEFHTPIPGVLQSNHDVAGAGVNGQDPDGVTDDKDVHVPDVNDALSINVDRNQDGVLVPVVGTLNTLADRYHYVAEVAPLTGFGPEGALVAMNEHNGTPEDQAVIDYQEIYDVLVVGSIRDYLANVPNDATLAGLQAGLAIHLQTLTEPALLNNLIDLSLSGVTNSSDADKFSYSFTLNLTVKDQYLIDLGQQMDANEILLPERSFSAGSTVTNPGVVELPADTRNVEVRASIVMPFSFELPIDSGDVDQADFSFAVPGDMNVAVDADESLNGLVVNTGFLGTEVTGPDSASSFKLHMDWDVKVTDPSSPANLGFTQGLPTSSNSGQIIANNPLPSDPGTPFNFPLPLNFEIKIGTQTTPTAVTVDFPAGSTTDIAGTQSALQSALNSAGLDIVTAGLTGSKLTLTLNSDITPLGFASNNLYSAAGDLEGTSAPTLGGVTFLMSVNGQLPKSISVTASADLDTHIGKLQSALDAAFGGGVVAVSKVDLGGGDFRVHFASSNPIEVTSQIELNAKNQITQAELSDPSFPEFIQVTRDTAADKLQVTMPLSVRNGVDFTPSGNPGIKVDIQPFDFSTADLKSDSSSVKRLTLPLTDLTGDSLSSETNDMRQYLDFNVVGTGEALGMFQQLETWMKRFRDTDMLAGYSIPFTQAVLGKILALEDLIHDALLIDDKDTTDNTADDIGKLLSKVTNWDPDNPDLILPGFSTVQELGARLNALGLLTPTGGGDYAAYDPTTRNLTYQVSLTHDLVDQDIGANFDLDLAPIGNISTQSKIKLSATAKFQALLGMEMGPGKIDNDTLLEKLNGGNGAGIIDGIAFTGAGDVRAIEGRLSAPATFKVTIIKNDNSTIELDVVVPKTVVSNTPGNDAGTDDNTTLAHLIEDINAARPAAISTLVEARLIGKRIEFVSTSNTVRNLKITTSTGDTAYTELGLPTTLATTVYTPTTGSTAVTPTDVKVSSDLTLKFYKNGEAAPSATILLKSASTGTPGVGEALTGGNNTLSDLVNDINAALVGSTLEGKIAASRSGNKIIFSGIDSSIASFEVEAVGAAKAQVGLTNPVVAGVFLIAANDIKDVFGKLSAPAHFDIALNGGSPISVTVSNTVTVDNTSIVDLIANINAALPPTLAGKIQAEQMDNFRIGFRAISNEVQSFEVTAAAADPAVTELGLKNGTDSANAALRIVAIKNAPYFLGPATDASFTVSINGGSPVSVTVPTSETLTNATIQDLVGDVRRALDTAFGGVNANPLLVSNDGNRILLKPKSASTTSFTINAATNNSAVTDLKLYTAGSNIAGPTVSSSADNADLLIYSRSGHVYRVDLNTATNISHVISAINALTGISGDPTPFEASINAISTGLKLVDKTAGPNTDVDGKPTFRVDSVNGSRAAQALGLFGTSVNYENTTADDTIDGNRIVTLQLVDRFFIKQVDPSTKILSADIGLDAPAGSLVLEGNFGFVGVKLTGEGNLGAEVGVGFQNPNEVIRLSDLFKALPNASDLAALLTTPQLTPKSPNTDFGSLTFGVQLMAGPAVGGFALGASPQITFTLNSFGDPFASELPDIDVTTSNLGDLINFEDIGFADLLQGLKGLNDFLSQFSAFDFLNQDMPLIGISFSDLVNIADRFAKAVEEIEANPAGTLQGVEQKVRETFGLPPGSSVFGLSLVDNGDSDGDSKDMLKVSLNLPKNFNKSLSIDLDLSPDGLPISLLGTAGLNASGSLAAKLALGVDLNDPTNLVVFTNQNDTSITGSLNASADNVTFNAALGPLGVFISGGNVDVDVDLSFKNDSAAADSRVPIADAFDNFEAAFQGSINATLPVFFPSQSSYVGDIGFNGTLELDGGQLSVGGTGLTIPDSITNLDFANFNLFGNLPLLIDAGDLFLSGIQDILDGEVFGFKLPLIGDKMADAARFIEDFRKEFVQPFRDLVESAPEKTETLVRGFLFDVLSSTGLLQDANGDNAVTSDDITIKGDPFGTKTPADDSDDNFVEFNFLLGQTFSPNVNLDIDLGFPGLNFKADGELGLTVGWQLGVGLGISTEDGAYIDLAPNDTDDTAEPDLKVWVDADIGNTVLTGTLGFLQLKITPRNDDFDGEGAEYDGDSTTDPTKFHAEFGLNLKNSSDDTDTRLSFFELGNLGVDISVLADAEVNFDITAQIDPELLPDTISAALPKVVTQFVLDWEISGGIDALSEIADGLQLVEFKDVSVDLGSFLADTVGPIVAKIQEITGPLQPIIDIMTARIPVLSDLAGRTITLLDIAASFGEFDASMIYAVADVISLVNSIQAGSGPLLLPLGSFTLINKANPDGSLLGGTGGGDLSNPNFSFGGLSDTDFANKLGDIGLGLGDLTDPSNLDGLLGGGADSPTEATAKNLFSGGFSSTPDSTGFAFPIFQNPSQIFGLLLGRNATLITYDLPPFLVDFKYEQSFPIYGPLWGVVSAGVGLKIDLAFGYDTQGVRDFMDGGFQNPLDLISGFYISDTNMPDGSFGVDVPELVFSGSIGVGAELNAGIASAGVTANINLTVNFDLYDPDHDGKVRINELVSTFLFEARNGDPALAPISIFDVSGDVSFQLNAYIKFLFAKFSFEVTPPIVLFEFSIPFDREPILATERGDGSVLLNIGPSAGARENGDTRDISEEIFVKDAGNGKVAVWSDQFGVPESAAQLYSIGGDNPVVVGNGGEGDDTIDVSGLSAYKAELTGDSGNDHLKGGSNDDTLSGGIGDDEIFGRGGKDLITGGEGNDKLDGEEGDDIIFGDSGAYTKSADTGSIRSSIGLKDGEDAIKGGLGKDIIFGGGGDDKIAGDDADAEVLTNLDAGGPNDDDFIFGDGGRIESPNGVPNLSKITNADGTVTYSFISLTNRAGGGNDLLRGQGGNDVVFGGTGNDDIDGGDQDDTLYGEAGFDLISGGGAADLIQGGTEDDRIFGYRDEVYPGAADGGDTIFGEQGNDFIRGNRGNDLIYGNAGADIIFGDYDDDQIFGQNEPDLIFGGEGSDYIEGGTGNDIVFGDDGLVLWAGFYGATHKVIGLVGGVADIQNLSQAAIAAVLPAGDDIFTTADSNALTMDLIISEVNGTTDGNDEIIGGEGDDIVLGGADGLLGDKVSGDFDPAKPLQGDVPAGKDILFGDGGRVQFNNRFRSEIRSLAGTAANEVGPDKVSGNGGDDIIFGGGNGDQLFGRMDASLFNGPNEKDEVTDNDIIVGDDGKVAYDTAGRISLIQTNRTAGFGGVDTAHGNKGDDIIFGGLLGDVLNGDAGEDTILGDNGEIEFQLEAGVPQVARIETTDTTEGTGGIDTISGDADNDIILGGVAGDALSGSGADDIIVGDNGKLLYNQDSTLSTLDLISSTRDNLGGVDTISGDAGNDTLVGGTAGDQMYGDNPAASNGSADGEDIMLGDNADIAFAGTIGRLIVQGSAVDSIKTTDENETTGGADTMSGNGKSDVILGGVNGDTLYGDAASPAIHDSDDILLGDNGLLDFSNGSDTDLNTLDLIRSAQDGLGASDTISGQRGADVAIGGTAGDVIYGDDAAASAAANDGADMLLGDNADIFLVAKGGAVGGDLKLVLGSAIATIRTTDVDHPEYGGRDTISGNAKGDIIAGGVAGDTIYGDRQTPNATTSLNDGNDIVLGDNGALEWLSTGRLNEITGIDIGANNPALFAKYGGALADTNLTTLDLITTEQPNSGGRDTIYGDEGSDLVFGGTDSDVIHGDDGNEVAQVVNSSNRDVLFGDHGRLYPQFSALGDFNSRNFFSIHTGDTDGGQGDQIWGEEGADVMLGGQGDDRMFGGTGDDDMIGGHNVSGGYDELTSPAIGATMASGGVNDLMDGGAGNDAMAGDNGIIWRRGDDVSPRFRLLTDTKIYTTTGSTIVTNVNTAAAAAQSDPDDAVGRDIQLVDHSDSVAANPAGRFGADVMAGGANSDVMFGELGNDLMEGDGNIGADDANATSITQQINVADTGFVAPDPNTSGSLFINIPEQATDGDDYLEGNGGNDLMYGGLGQDDIIGGSSALFGLTNDTMRPDGSDTIFGGAGIRTHRNDVTDPASNGHSRDADYIVGDNANVFRLVKASDLFQVFAYDNYAGTKIVPRAIQQLDYTLGGADYAGGSYTNGIANADNGDADLINGEDGDDIIFGMTGSDVIYGNAQDDDIIGGYGHDWISGGTGQDGVLGDDGLIFTSRNGTAEPLYGIAATVQETISTPGQIQSAVINTTGELKKSVDLVPFSFDNSWNAVDDEFPDNADGSPYADDIIFGGLGSDFLHGGSGDDAISGAEALDHAYVPVYDAAGNATGVRDLGYAAVNLGNRNPGNVLAFNPEDTDGQHLNNRFRAGEFRLYDEYDPLRKILLTATGELSKNGTGFEFLLNFNQNEGISRDGGTITKGVTYPAVKDDGNDVLFGDLANDWLVGGTGRDNSYGGWGNDLINADDDQTTHGLLNDQPDTHPTYEDRAYGGAGRDVLIANTGGDRLIDWVGEYNSYLVPFAPFGEATVSRTLQPALHEFLYALSRADGADATRSADTGADALRNGEPNGELGAVLQKDFAWKDQTGAPADPQAGNIPGGKRDVLRSADFNDNKTQGFVPDSGSWSTSGGRYQVAPTVAGGDAVSVYYVDSFVPHYFEMTATINAVKPTGGTNANAYLIFDYQSPTDFKFAGINVSTSKLEIGHRTQQGWIVDKQAPFQSGLKAGTDYNVFLALNGSAVTLTVNNQVSMAFNFAPRVDAYGMTHGLNDGMVGLGAKNAKAQIDNVTVQRVAPVTTLNQTIDFSTWPNSLFQTPLTGVWNAGNGRYLGTPGAGGTAIDLLALKVHSGSYVDLVTTLKTTGEGGLIFDQYSADDFKFVTINASTKQIILGHRTSRGWFTDAVFNYSALSSGVDYNLGLTLKGTTVSVSVNGQTFLSYAYNSQVTDGGLGLFGRTGQTSFDSVTVKTDDPAFSSL